MSDHAATIPSLNGKNILITGGASGIGREVARAYALQGSQVHLIDNQDPSLLSEPLPTDWTYSQVDVMDSERLTRSISEIGERTKSLDSVVISAGVVPAWGSIAEMDPQKWDEVFAINVSAAMVTIKSVIPFLSHRSSITVIASMNSWRGDKNLPSYVASKHAVLGLVRSAALELGPSGVRVNAVGPGPVATPALVERIRRREGENNVDEALESLGAQTALRKLVTAGEVAQAVIFLGSDFSSGITGQLLNVDGGMN